MKFGYFQLCHSCNIDNTLFQNKNKKFYSHHRCLTLLQKYIQEEIVKNSNDLALAYIFIVNCLFTYTKKKIMGKGKRAEAGTPKWLANKMKSKGLQKLRWYCQMCEKQCRDENGFKCHTSSKFIFF